jgi:hypothetical protein
MGYSLDGIGLARPSLEHQRITRNIVINYYNYTDFDEYEAFQEGLANPLNPNSLVPDVIFMKDDKVHIAIEIVKDNQFNSNEFKGKIKDLITIYNIHEVFVYNYEKRCWYCFGNDLNQDEPSYSYLLEIDLDDLIEL